MADFKVFLTPLDSNEIPEPQILERVDMGWNQIGWLVFTNAHKEAVGSFAPGSVRFAIRTDDNQVEVVRELPPNVIKLN